MYIYIILIFNLINFSNSLQIIFSPCSIVKKSFYNNFLKKLQNKINLPILLKNSNINEKKIIISHCFDTRKELLKHVNRDKNIIGLILVQNHFNQRKLMPYLDINQNKIKIPVLTILNSHDELIPLCNSIDDFLISYQENIPNKYYFINNGTHYSSFENKLQMELLTNQIELFISEISKNNFSRMETVNKYIINKNLWFFQDRNLKDTILQSNLFNFILKSRYNNSLYLNNKYALLKTNKINITEELDTFYNLNLVYNYSIIELNNNRDYMNITQTMVKFINNFMIGNSLKSFFLLFEFIIKGIINDFITTIQKPKILLNWFNYEPKIYVKNNKMECEIIGIPIKDNIIYYKFPSKHKIFEFKIKKKFL
jgi:hypothetical protein